MSTLYKPTAIVPTPTCDSAVWASVICAGSVICGDQGPTPSSPSVGAYDHLNNIAGMFFISSPAFVSGSGTIVFALAHGSGPLPVGLTLDSATGVISGSVATPQVFSVTISASNGVGAPAIVPVTYVITAAGVAPGIGSYGTTAGLVGTPFVSELSFLTGTAPVYVNLTSGILPPGLTLATDGRITGTPSVIGSYTFVVTATNGILPSAGVTTEIVINAAPTLSGYANTNGVVGSPFTSSPIVTGSAGFSFTSGALPFGLTLNASTGEITGTPTTVQSLAVSITVSNGYGSPATITRTFTISPAVPPVYYGKLSAANADDVAIAALSSLQVSSIVNTSWNFPAGASQYSYLALPAVLEMPISMKDGVFNWVQEFASPYQYSTGTNGYSFFKLLTIGGSQYRVFRSLYPTGGAFTLSLT